MMLRTRSMASWGLFPRSKAVIGTIVKSGTPFFRLINRSIEAVVTSARLVGERQRAAVKDSGLLQEIFRHFLLAKLGVSARFSERKTSLAAFQSHKS